MAGRPFWSQKINAEPKHKSKIIKKDVGNENIIEEKRNDDIWRKKEIYFKKMNDIKEIVC